MNGVNWMGAIQAQVSSFVLAYSGIFVPLGLFLLTVVYVCKCYLIGMAGLQGRINQAFWRILALTMMTVGAAWGLNNYPTVLHTITSLGVDLTNAINTAMVNTFMLQLNNILMKVPKPSAWNLIEVVGYFLFMLDMALIQFAMLFINAYGYAGLAIHGMFGPLKFWAFITDKHDGKFYSWVETMIGYSLYSAVGAAITFIYAGVFIQFFNGLVSFNIGYLIGMLVVLVSLTLVFAVTMFRIPHFVQELMHGMGSGGAGFAAAVGSFVARAF